MKDFFIITGAVLFALVIGFAAGQRVASITPKCESYTIPNFTGQWCIKHDKQGNIYYSRKNVRVYLD